MHPARSKVILVGVEARSERVLGALLGAQEGRSCPLIWIDIDRACPAYCLHSSVVRRIDVHNSFELVLQEESGERHEGERARERERASKQEREREKQIAQAEVA